MTEEEYFRKNFPDSCYGDKPLSPHWDYFQYGVEFGERQSEKKVAELERKLEQTEKDLADYQFNYPTIKELQKENAELKEKLSNAETSNDWYRRSSYGSLFEQIAKAKELLKQWVNSYGYIDVALCNQTDQFISEAEK